MDWVEYGRTILKQEGHDDWSFRLDIEALPSLCIHHNKRIWLAKVHQDDIFYIIHEIAHIPFLDLSEGDIGHHRRWAAEFYRLLITYVTPLPIGRTVEEIDESDRRATQLFAIQNVLIGHCDKGFSADKIDAAMADIKREMSEGGCAWAFSDEVKPLATCRHDAAVSVGFKYCPDCGKRLVPPTEEPKTIPKAVIDAFRDDEEALLKEHLEEDTGFSIITWKCPSCGLTKIDPPNLEELRKRCPNCGAGTETERVRCCHECVSFHQSRTKQLTSLADPNAPNDGCQCKCHDPSTPEGAALIKHFDNLDLQDEVDKTEAPTNHPLNCPAVYSLGDDEACSTCLSDPRPFDKCPPLTKEPPACFGESSLCVISKKLQEKKVAEEPKWKCISCGLEQPATNEVCPHCGQLRELVREPDDMIGRGDTDPNERED